MLRITMIILVFNLIIFGILWKNIQIATLKYEITLLKEQKKEKYLELEKLKASLAKVFNAENIERLYKEKYGYMPIDLSQKIITVQITDSNTEK